MSMRSRSRSKPMASVCVCSSFDDLGVEIERGCVLGERAAGKDVDVSGDLCAHTGKWHQALVRAPVRERSARGPEAFSAPALRESACVLRGRS